MSTLIIDEKTLQKLFYVWKIRVGYKGRGLMLSYETKNLNDLQSGVISNKVFIYDLDKKTWLTKPKSKGQLLKYLITTL